MKVHTNNKMDDRRTAIYIYSSSKISTGILVGFSGGIKFVVHDGGSSTRMVDIYNYTVN